MNSYPRVVAVAVVVVPLCLRAVVGTALVSQTRVPSHS